MKKEAIVLKYSSTRGNAEQLDSAKAIIRGLAADGGLFVPDAMPQVDMAFIEGLKALSYEERAEKVLGLFLTDYTAEELAGCVTRAYANGRFDTEKRAPVKAVGEKSVLELWHGPTSAFKDMALQMLPYLLTASLQKTGEHKKVCILVATSGDTGKAALAGFADAPGTAITVFYPEGKVSQVQELQMTTQAGSNVQVAAVEGNFDDAQSAVKRIFGDKDFNEALAAKGIRLSSANSINWGRLVPQIVYYFSAYADLLSSGKIEPGEAIDFTVPTGNFGDILAGFYAKCMGLPVHKLICASNANNVLTDFLRTGVYDRQRDFFKTISPSMDILISSNLERLLYHMTEDKEKVASWMQQLQQQGRYDVGSELLAKIQETFWADWTSDEDTEACIAEVYRKHHYAADPHTAVAWSVAEKYQQATGDAHHMVVVSTASPYKFNGSVLDALGVKTQGVDEFTLLDELQQRNEDPIPEGLASLRKKAVRHDGVCAPATMEKAVMLFASADSVQE